MGSFELESGRLSGAKSLKMLVLSALKEPARTTKGDREQITFLLPPPPGVNVLLPVNVAFFSFFSNGSFSCQAPWRVWKLALLQAVMCRITSSKDKKH
jgi:hypothetical protein